MVELQGSLAIYLDMKITEEQKRLVIRLYSEGVKISQIEETSKVKGGSINRILQEYGIKANRKPPNRKNTSSEEIAIELYKQGVSTSEIFRATGIPEYTLHRRLKKSGVDFVPKKHLSSKYKLENPDFFEDVKTDAQGYILGFLMVDGHIKKDELTIEIALQEKDECILQAIKKHLGYDAPISSYTPSGGYSSNSKACKLCIHSKKLIQDIHTIGFGRLKPDRDYFPLFKTEEATNGFIRGVFDADGTVSYRLTNNQTVRGQTVTILGGEVILKGISRHFSAKGIPDKGIKEAHGSIKAVRYHSAYDFMKICSLFYPNSNVLCLKRKKEKIEFLADYYSRSNPLKLKIS